MIPFLECPKAFNRYHYFWTAKYKLFEEDYYSQDIEITELDFIEELNDKVNSYIKSEIPFISGFENLLL